MQCRKYFATMKHHTSPAGSSPNLTEYHELKKFLLLIPKNPRNPAAKSNALGGMGVAVTAVTILPEASRVVVIRTLLVLPTTFVPGVDQ